MDCGHQAFLDAKILINNLHSMSYFTQVQLKTIASEEGKHLLGAMTKDSPKCDIQLLKSVW